MVLSMTRYVRYVTAVNTGAFGNWFSQIQGLPVQNRVLGELFFAEPILSCLSVYAKILRVKTAHVTRRDNDIEHLQLEQRNPYLYGLSLFQKHFRSRRSRLRRSVFPSWNRRRSLSVHGDFTGYPLLDVAGVFGAHSLPLGVSTRVIKVSRVYTPTGVVNHFSFDDCIRLARDMYQYVGSEFRKNANLGRYGRHTLSAMSITTDAITYTLKDIEYKSYPSGTWHRCSSLHVTITRDEDGDTQISLSGLENCVFNNDPSQPKATFVPSVKALSYILSKDDLSVSTDMHIHVNGMFGRVKMREFRPALYHTQGSAMTKVLQGFGRNFENFIEAPGLITLFDDIAVSGPPWLVKALGVKNAWVERVRTLALLVSGSILAWNFAVKPTLASVKELADGALIPVEGEAEIRFDTRDLNSLPSGLKAWIDVRTDYYFRSTDIDHVLLVFKTHVTSAPDAAVLSRAAFEADPLSFLGLYPTPKGIWDTMPMSFIVDWFVPIGRMIEDHTSYLRAPSLECRIGHTVLIRITSRSGLNYDLFWRSSYGERPTDPPGDSWLVAPGLPTISLPLAVSMLFGSRKGQS